MNCVVIKDYLSNKIDILKEVNCVVLSYIGSHYHWITIPKGKWKFELWGAGSGLSPFYGEGPELGLGAYVSGLITLRNEVEWYAYVGGRGNDNSPRSGVGGFNGGGTGGDDINCGAGGGGGATDIRLNKDDLYSRIIVAGGGGSPGCYKKGGNGGSGGTIYGCNGISNEGKTAVGGKGADFTNFNLFGIGESGVSGNEGGAAGGGGYFGGYQGISINVAETGGSGGGGGSSYVSGCDLCRTLEKGNDGKPYLSGNIHSSQYSFKSIQMIAGNDSLPSYPSNEINYSPHISHGLIKISKEITKIENCASNFVFDFNEKISILFVIIFL